MYQVRHVNIGTDEQLRTLAHAAGEVYTRTVVFYWRTVRHKGIWLQPKHLMRLIPSDPENRLHAHTVDATVQAFFASLKSWRKRRKNDPNSKPPKRRKWFFRVE